MEKREKSMILVETAAMLKEMFASNSYDIFSIF